MANEIKTGRFLIISGWFFFIIVPTILAGMAIGGKDGSFAAGLFGILLLFSAGITALFGLLVLLLGYFRKLSAEESTFDLKAGWLPPVLLLICRAGLEALRKTSLYPEAAAGTLLELALGILGSIALLLFFFFWTTELVIRFQRNLPGAAHFYFWPVLALACFFLPML